MTRDQHLVFCKKCLNRRFDSQQGLICNITGKIADFEANCENFKVDGSVKEKSEPVEQSHAESIAALPDDVLKKLLPHQDLQYAVVGGFFLAIISALLWAVITVSTQYQIGYMALGVGFIVGMGVRFFGAGVDPVYGYIGGLFSLIGCLLGNLFSTVGFIAQEQSLGYFETLGLLDFETIVLIFQETFSFMDVVFYGLAIYEGYKFAFRPVPADARQRTDLTPAYSKLRLPLVVVSFSIILVSGFTLRSESNGSKTFFYESGEKMSTGEYVDGKEHGSWGYFYESGTQQLKANYIRGKEEGIWEWYYENGMLMRKGSYKNGLFDGIWINYYQSGALSDSSVYLLGRLNGPFVSRHENGKVFYEGDYVRDQQHGVWTLYFDSGVKTSEMIFDNGIPRGIWKYWDTDGNPVQETEHVGVGDYKILNAWNKDGEKTISNGSGELRSYFENGSIQQIGRVENGKKIGVWKTYYPDGTTAEEGKFEGDIYKIVNSWGPDGKRQVESGEGNYTSFFQNSSNPFEKGLIKQGLREGLWETYFDNSIIIQQETNYTSGQPNGSMVSYYQNGNILTEGTMKDGKKEGVWNWYNESDGIESSATFSNDKKDGTQTFWSETGYAVKEEVYERGILISEKLLTEE